jgi:hypothetical protein
MQKTLIFLLALALIVLAFVTVDAKTRHHFASTTYNYNDGDLSIDFEGSSLIITCDYDDYDVVEINAEYELYVNDDEIKLDQEEQKLVKEFYDQSAEVQRSVKKIAAEGARIGLKGAKLGLKAIGGLFKAALTSYTTDDLERDIEWEAERIEADAEVLERKAKKIERQVDLLEDIGIELTDRIPELQEIECFW